jgi:hypothetical protein
LAFFFFVIHHGVHLVFIWAEGYGHNTDEPWIGFEVWLLRVDKVVFSFVLLIFFSSGREKLYDCLFCGLVRLGYMQLLPFEFLSCDYRSVCARASLYCQMELLAIELKEVSIYIHGPCLFHDDSDRTTYMCTRYFYYFTHLPARYLPLL